MKTEAVREAVGRLNRRLETSETQSYRLAHVLHGFFLCTRENQLALAEAAIIWAVAALASHERRDECQSFLHAISDIMYAATEDAEKTLTESDRLLIFVAATELRQHLHPGIGDISRQSAKKLDTFEKDDQRRMVAAMLHLVRFSYLEHAPVTHLPKLILHCYILCAAIEGCEVDAASRESAAIENVVNLCSLLVFGQ